MSDGKRFERNGGDNLPYTVPPPIHRRDTVMNIAVVAANGRVGQLVVKEALERGHSVTAIVRGANRTEAAEALVKDLFELTAQDLAGYDVVVDAFGAWTPDVVDQHPTSLMHLCDALSGSDTRLLVVGGAGSLYVDADHTTQLCETPDFPAEFLPLAHAQGQALTELRKRNDVRWTFISPAADFQAEGARTGRFTWAGEELTPNGQGESVISYADYAIAMVDEAERTDGANVRKRISVVSA